MIEVSTLQRIIIELAIVAVLIIGIAQFRAPVGARRGNYLGAVAMAFAIVFVLVSNDVRAWWVVGPAFAIGAAVGWVVSERVNMIQIPAMVALQNGMGGLASMLVSFVELTRASSELSTVSIVSGYAGIVVGAVTLSGSLVAAGRLSTVLKQQPTFYKRHNLILLLVLGVIMALIAGAALTGGAAQQAFLLALIAASLYLGVVFAIRIGGADMPVIISFLNTLSGLAAAIVGVTIQNTLLIAAGATVTSSGSILTWVMCTSMNRSLLNVLTGTMKTRGGGGKIEWPGAAEAAPAAPAADDPQSRSLAALAAAESVIIVPGYGMAQAHAAPEVARLADLLERRGKRVRFAVHPVAGRMPGHMHVLLAEAEVEYEKLFEMKDINDDFAATDAVLVVGACDVVNPAAIRTEGTPISGMPILRAHEAGAVIVANLDEKPGYSGVDNPLYEDPKALLLFGDAKDTVERLIVGLESAAEG